MAAPGEIETLCMACDDQCNFQPTPLRRRPVGDLDVLIDIKFCGVCHSDLGNAKGDNAFVFGKNTYPVCPGHEISGVVVAVGPKVKKFVVGDMAGVGCWVDSCMKCKNCKNDKEHYCGKAVATYIGNPKRTGHSVEPDGGQTKGGYSKKIVVHEAFVVKIPEGFPPELAGPIMCSGVTMYEPLKEWGATAGGKKVGIVGLGGLGVMGLKLAKAVGCNVTAISRAMSKAGMAKEAGADAYIATSEESQMKEAAGTLDLILDTVPDHHDYSGYLKLLAKKGKLVFVGMNALNFGGLVIAKIGGIRPKCPCQGTNTGSIKSTQEVVDLCAKSGITPNVEVRPVQDLNSIFTMLAGSNDSGKRYVLDMGTLTEETAATTKDLPPPDLAKHAPKPISQSSIAKTVWHFMWTFK